MTRRTINVEYLARVEGEGALNATIRDGVVEQVELNIFEPPRFFEAFLRGRDFREAPDITARICGICPVAYQMSAVHAMEAACGGALPDPLHVLRRLLYCGEWIESHVLHIFMLHAPDFLGCHGVVEMAKTHGDLVRRALRMKKAGNAIVATVGGREVHPVNVRVGGFYRAPRRADLLKLRDELQWARDAAIETLNWAAGLPYPDYERDYLLVALRNPSHYPMNEGRIVSSAGLDIPYDDFENHFQEIHVPHSTALHGRTKQGRSYLVGPLARFALNHDRLSPEIVALAEKAGLTPSCRNPYKSLIARAVEVLFAFDLALEIIDGYREPDAPAIDVEPREANGRWATEAPRGLLYHRYEIGDDGLIKEARIVPPTSQNQPSIEKDVRGVIEANLDMADDVLQHRCEQTIRNYDPCISCSTHFLKLNIERLTGDEAQA
ncbi:Ni/Fe hydrogenase subunit alpha [Hyphococcus luteus]|uniref:Ni/Fe hydrogenase subunit alpha n=1 Tax=Hyphococcus luteus TaxID=2058213 RepID=A0A2S7K0I1_9PROT|nr:Ni/Fe hydrogenase subunit alpha [Marinicaulis flavus]PQA85971.1 Ni/Fe hydrogenase subunit alpha [Marinicaulis flavus]